ncbi:tripartite tricarboxylate transporter substrate binding protein [Rhodovarius sp.]|uniref:tripartite tricarboxylate transporter substrate binding protein n=1 Tax=Rhodovarius sp. TaxID=2972673 RepID=UPI0033419907
MIIRALLLSLALLLPAAAQEVYPSRPVQLIILYPPGGNTDLMARALQAELSRALGVSVVGVNRGGAAGAIGNAEVARARPDGLTIGVSPNNAITTQPFLQATPYQADGFRYICQFYDNPQVVILGRNAPFSDLRGMIAFARTGKEALVYGAPGQGSTQHILFAQLLRAAGVDGLMVSYTGAGPMAAAALAGTIMAFAESASIAASTGLQALAVLADRRMPGLPEVPTSAELGMPMNGSTYGGLLAPLGLRDAMAAVLERACEAAVASEGFRNAAERLSAAPSFLPGAAFRARFLAEAAVNRTLLQELGLSNR